ncbi:hypothetical protein CBR_g32284 [Chara braunii]|uniref:Uncharacterized protein n=1 Tax=Chara braunii TaxID=69332 RepID=A0A388JN73_CHABU|nr:hypothetical protein CBR_g32284 [Chara braunii]|eukprot:GBG59269.1 hypothetical protein CBR_g32284 [Chara braunii]
MTSLDSAGCAGDSFTAGGDSFDSADCTGGGDSLRRRCRSERLRACRRTKSLVAVGGAVIKPFTARRGAVLAVLGTAVETENGPAEEASAMVGPMSYASADWAFVVADPTMNVMMVMMMLRLMTMMLVATAAAIVVLKVVGRVVVIGQGAFVVMMMAVVVAEVVMAAMAAVELPPYS